VIFISYAAIEFECCIVSAIDFQMDGIHSPLAGFFLRKFESLPAKTAPAVRRVDIELVDERVVTMKLEAEAQRQHDIADRSVPLKE